MKLYAKMTSERASKGQGGNREIVIDLLIDSVARKTIGRVVMRYGEKGEGVHEGYTVYYYPVEPYTCKGGRILLHQEKLEETKGNKKKGEVCCDSCACDIKQEHCKHYHI